jgi:hypothetical protein
MASFVGDSEKHHAATFVSILRVLIGLIGLVAAAGVTALAARHGYITGATPFDRTAAALTFSIIALTGLVGPTVAWRLYLSSRLKPLAVLLGIVSAAALVTNVTHLAAAVDKVATIGANVLPPAFVSASPRAVSAPNNDESELQRIAAGRAALYFNPTSEDAVAAARAAYMEADAAHRADCSERQNPKCEALAADLASKQAAFLAAARDRIATVEAEKLDAEAASLRARSGSEPSSPVAQQSQGATVPQPSPILEPSSPETGSPSQIAIAMAGQLAIAFSLILWGVPGRQSRAAAINQAIADIPVRAPKREPAGDGDLTLFVRDCISPAGGGSVKFRDLYLRFLDWCDEQQLSALPPQKFSQAVVKRCAEAQIEVRCEGADVVCLDVKLVPAHLLH